MQLHIYVLKEVNSGRKSLVVCVSASVCFYVRMRMGSAFCICILFVNNCNCHFYTLIQGEK